MPPPFITLPPNANAFPMPFSTCIFTFVFSYPKPAITNLLKITFSPFLSRISRLRVLAVLNWKIKKGIANIPPMIMQLTLISSSLIFEQVQKPERKQTIKAMEIALIRCPSSFQQIRKPSKFYLNLLIWIDGVLISGFAFLILEKRKRLMKLELRGDKLAMRDCYWLSIVLEMRLTMFMATNQYYDSTVFKHVELLLN